MESGDVFYINYYNVYVNHIWLGIAYFQCNKANLDSFT